MKTKEYFRKDIRTMKNSFKATLRYSFWLFLISFAVTSLFNYLFSHEFNLGTVMIYSLVFWPIVSLLYFLLHVMKTKGYGIYGP